MNSINHHHLKNYFFFQLEKLFRRSGLSRLSSTYELRLNSVRIGPIHTLSAGIRLLHMSDFHHSSSTPLAFIKSAIEMGLKDSPDLICLTGDYVTGQLQNYTAYRAVLGELSRAAPTFACFGNHDGSWQAERQGGYREVETVRQLLDSSGITCLENEAKRVSIKGQNFDIAGLGDWRAGAFRPADVLDRAGGSGITTIVLAHNPAVVPLLDEYHWDLVLCGHTHGGQFKLPLLGPVLLSGAERDFSEGLFERGNGWVHVTRGVGNLFGLRVNCPPELNLIELMSK